MARGDFLLTRFKALLEAEGISVVVTRRPGTQGGASTTQTLKCLAQPMAVGDVSPIAVEGEFNSGQDNPIMFKFAGDADVKEALDKVRYKGADYRLSGANPRLVQGVSVTLSIVGTRTGL
jgi:hypothetical protein